MEDVQDLLSKFSVMKKDELIAECRSKKLTIRGNKDALAKRLAEYQVIIIIIVVLVIGTFISSRERFSEIISKSRERSWEIISLESDL